MTKEEIRTEQLDGWWEDYLKGCNEEQNDSSSKFLELIDLMGEDKNVSILDIGCGIGTFLILLKENGFTNLSGIDTSTVATTEARKYGLNVITADIEADSFMLTEKYDVIVMTHVLEHIFSPINVLNSINTYLKDNGRLILSVPNAGWFLNGLLLSFFPRSLALSPAFGSWTHCNQYTYYTLKKQLGSCGFIVKEFRGSPTSFKYRPDRKLIHKYLACVFTDVVFRISSLFIKIKPTVFSTEISVMALKKDRNEGLY